MAINPYESPTLDVVVDEYAKGMPERDPATQDEPNLKWTLLALRVIRLGDAIQLFCVGMMALLLLVWSPTAKTLSTLPSLVVLGGIGGGVALSFLGLVLLTSQKHRQHSATLLAIIFHVVASIAITIFLAAMIRSSRWNGAPLVLLVLSAG